MPERYDQLGNPVPEQGHVALAFADAEIVRQCLIGIRNYSKVLARMEPIRRIRTAGYIGRVLDAMPLIQAKVDDLLSAFPYAICEKCNGRPGSHCTGCNNRGWLHRNDYELAEKEKLHGRRLEDGSRRRATPAIRQLLKVLSHGKVKRAWE